MSAIGSPSELSALQAAQAQQVASRARDKEKAAETARRAERKGVTARGDDMVDVQLNGVVTAEAARALPQNDSEQAETEHESHHPPHPPPPPPSAEDLARRIDVRA